MTQVMHNEQDIRFEPNSMHMMMSPAMTSRSTVSSQPYTYISSPTSMLPDDHCNDIEMLSFGLTGTHLNCASASGHMHHDPNESIIHYAASNNYLELLKKLITIDHVDIDSFDVVGFEFNCNNKINVSQMLHFIKQEGNTPLLLASSVGNSDIVKYLLDHGANVNIQNNFVSA